MQTNIELSPNEAELIAPILASFSARAKYQITLDKLLRAWNKLVMEVENGYSDSIYEYENDLASRELLQEILLQAPPSLYGKLMNVLQPLDDRFKEATRAIQRSLINKESKELGFWWFRIPKELSNELESDLRTMGILD